MSTYGRSIFGSPVATNPRIGHVPIVLPTDVAIPISGMGDYVVEADQRTLGHQFIVTPTGTALPIRPFPFGDLETMSTVTRYVTPSGRPLNGMGDCGCGGGCSGCTCKSTQGMGSELMMYQAHKGGPWKLVEAAAGYGESPDGLGETALTAHVTGTPFGDAALGAVIGFAVSMSVDEKDRGLWVGGGALAGAAGGLLGLGAMVAAGVLSRKKGY